LAELLKLNQYDDLKKGRRIVALFKGQAEQLERNLQSMETQLHQREVIALQRADLETQLNQLNKSKHLTIYNYKVCKLFSTSGKLATNNFAGNTKIFKTVIASNKSGCSEHGSFSYRGDIKSRR